MATKIKLPKDCFEGVCKASVQRDLEQIAADLLFKHGFALREVSFTYEDNVEGHTITADMVLS